jgi:beta-galactosidase
VFCVHAVQLAGEVSRRYGDDPALRLWHNSHEQGCHKGRCLCDMSAAASRRRLAARYGDVSTLNDA